MQFKESLSDQSLFIYINEKVTIYFLVYVDDIVLTSSLEEFTSLVISNLAKEFEINDLESLQYFLGIHITKLPNGELFVLQ